jgi:N6-L-threonylcarbamoyladenine synthase
MMRVIHFFGIETSCDETAAAVVAAPSVVCSNVVYSQIAEHAPFGGVVPEIASRAHVERLPGIVQRALDEAGIGWGEVDAVAVTSEPGLAGALLVGVAAAKALARRLDRPLVAVHHIEAHLRSVFIGEGAALDPRAPTVALVVSGGHTSLFFLPGGNAPLQLLGQTLDDAAGEALDKGAKLLGLAYPGGPAIERAAEGGDPRRVPLPRARASAAAAGGLDPELCFSFSGLKTALMYYLRDHPEGRHEPARRDVAASYEEAVIAALAERVEAAAARTGAGQIAAAGGVARNRRLRRRLGEIAARRGARLGLAAPELCTDNAAMVAAAAAAGFGRTVHPPNALEIRPTSPLGLDAP